MEINLTKERITDLISQKGISKAEFAKRLGYERNNLDAYLNSKKKDINMVLKMADVLGMSLYEFIGMPEPGMKELYGCLYVNGRPLLIHNRAELLDLVKSLEE